MVKLLGKLKFIPKPKLSKQEFKILNFIEQGLKNKEIAIAMNLNQNTISTYIRNIKSKLKVDNDMNTYILIKTAKKLKYL